AKAFDVAQVQEAQAKSPIAIRRGQTHQPVGDPGVLFASLGLVAVARLADLEGLAGMPDAGAPAFDRSSGHLPAQRWPHHFFGSSPNSGERGPDLEEEVGVIAEAVGHALDDLDLVVDA